MRALSKGEIRANPRTYLGQVLNTNFASLPPYKRHWFSNFLLDVAKLVNINLQRYWYTKVNRIFNLLALIFDKPEALTPHFKYLFNYAYATDDTSVFSRLSSVYIANVQELETNLI